MNTVFRPMTRQDLFVQVEEGLTIVEEISAAVMLAARGITDKHDQKAALFLADRLEDYVADLGRSIGYLRDDLGLKVGTR